LDHFLGLAGGLFSQPTQVVRKKFATALVFFRLPPLWLSRLLRFFFFFAFPLQPPNNITTLHRSIATASRQNGKLRSQSRYGPYGYDLDNKGLEKTKSTKDPNANCIDDHLHKDMEMGHGDWTE
jgi:hypothetical protein